MPCRTRIAFCKNPMGGWKSVAVHMDTQEQAHNSDAINHVKDSGFFGRREDFPACSIQGSTDGAPTAARKNQHACGGTLSFKRTARPMAGITLDRWIHHQKINRR